MRQRRFRPSAISLALAAMMLRALLPDGWMPAGAASAAAFTICSVKPAQHDGKAPTGPEHAQTPCAFAAVAPLAPPTLAPPIVRPSTAVQFVPPRVANESVGPNILHRPNLARAPPTFT